jgi:hypothetical protein
MKDKDEEGEKVGKNWVDGEIFQLITLRGEIELDFAQNVNKRVISSLPETLVVLKLIFFKKNYFQI